jgi:hypothetical protein
VTIAAGPVADALMTALIALFDLSPKSRRPAHLDSGHDAPLGCGHRRAVLSPIGFAVTAEDIRHFQLGAIHGPDAQKY